MRYRREARGENERGEGERGENRIFLVAVEKKKRESAKYREGGKEKEAMWRKIFMLVATNGGHVTWAPHVYVSRETGGGDRYGHSKLISLLYAGRR